MHQDLDAFSLSGGQRSSRVISRCSSSGVRHSFLHTPQGRRNKARINVQGAKAFPSDNYHPLTAFNVDRTIRRSRSASASTRDIIPQVNMGSEPAPPTMDGTSNGIAATKKSKAKAGMPSPEEIEAKRAARALKKQREAEEKARKEAELKKALEESGDSEGRIPGGHLDKDGNILFVPRAWGKVMNETEKSSNEIQGKQRKIKVVSWNILAQGLVRRKLFPVSDCLKFKDRSLGLTAELSSRRGHGWDVGCFQEVDRMEVHGETLEQDGFSWLYEKGYEKKQHGLLIAWRRSLFGEQEAAKLIVYFDDEDVAGHQRKACSRVTRNVGLFAALRFQSPEGGESPSPRACGVIVATTHLFWHPMHAYERARQSGILKRRLDEFRTSLGDDWSESTVILAGDFNDQPHSATYHLLTGRNLTGHCIQELKDSTVVHKSIDEKKDASPAISAPTPAAPPAATEASPQQTARQDVREDDDDDDDQADAGCEAGDEEGEEEEGGSDDRMLKNCRAATADDGLLSIDELIQLHDLSQPRPGDPTSSGAREGRSPNAPASGVNVGLLSAYGVRYGSLDPPEEDNFFGVSSIARLCTLRTEVNNKCLQPNTT